MRILLLGGTTEARQLAEALAEQRQAPVEVILSLAGRTRAPATGPAALRVGGFGGAEGLAAYLNTEAIDLLVDATHPFAAGMSANAHAAAIATGIPLLRLARPAWRPTPDDRWTVVQDMAAAAVALGRDAGRTFLTVGINEIDRFANCPVPFFLVRLIEPPARPLPLGDHVLVLDRGPFRVGPETDLMRQHRIDTLVTKNSGGSATRAKLDAARALRLRVIMVDRPPEPAAHIVDTVPASLDWIMDKSRISP